MKRWFVMLIFAAGCAVPQRPAEKSVAQTSVEMPADEVAEVGDFDFTTTDVDFTDIPLQGELLRPVTDKKVPAALIVHDWDVTLREGLIGAAFGVGLPGEVAVYRGLAEGLAARGVAVLIFDKRSCIGGDVAGGSCPPVEVEGRSGRGEDVQAALRWLAEQDGVASVNLIAHAAGSSIAVAQASSKDAPKVRSLVLLHPTMSPLDDLARFQLEESVRLIDERIAAVGDTPEADLLKQKRAEVQSEISREDVLRVGKEGRRALADQFARFTSALDSLPAILVIEAGLDPGDPPSESEARIEAFGADRVATVSDLSRTMVSVGLEDDATVVSPEVVTRVSAFLRAPE